jgi:hypothetical protein
MKNRWSPRIRGDDDAPRRVPHQWSSPRREPPPISLPALKCLQRELDEDEPPPRPPPGVRKESTR